MTAKRTPRPRDPIQLAKLIGDIATGQAADAVDDGKDPAAVTRGQAGGLLGGKSRANNLTPARRREIAKAAAHKRWGSSN